MFSLRACHTLFGGSWLFDHDVNCKGYDFYKNHGQSLNFASLPLPHKYNPGEGCEKSLFVSETQMERTISESKLIFVVVLVELNTSEEVITFHFFIQSLLNKLWDETLHGIMPLMVNVYLLNLNPYSLLT